MKKILVLGLMLLAAGARAETWDKTTPLGTEAKSLGDDRIRELKAAIELALNHSGSFPGSNPSSTPQFQWTLNYGLDANKPVSNLTTNEIYFSTDNLRIQLYNGSSWIVLLSTSNLYTYLQPTIQASVIPSGTKMMFYQAACPAGWTGVVTSTDVFARIVTAGTTGGSTGGTTLASTSLEHTHNMAHTHSLPDHTHSVPRDGWGSSSASTSGRLNTGITANNMATGDNTTGLGGAGTSGAASSSSTGATSTGLAAFARADVIICSKN